MGGAGVEGRVGAANVRDADFDRVAASVRGWATHLTQLGPGRGRGSVMEAVLPASRLVRLLVDTPVALEALPLAPRPDEVFHVGTVSFPANRVLWDGIPVGGDVLMHDEEGEIPSSFALPGGCELLVARLDRGRIEALGRVLRGDEGPEREIGPRIHAQPSSMLAELRSLLRVLVREELPERGGLSVEDELYERVVSMLAAPLLPVRLCPETRRRALRRTEEYMHAHARERISLSDLCRAAECSERTLRQVFVDCYATSPMAFLKKLRLQGLRRDLRDATPHSTTVLTLALRWGFWHLGHLGREYRSLFGETPFETLSGSEPRTSPPVSTRSGSTGQPATGRGEDPV